MFKVSVVLGIRPDFIRTSKVLKLLEEHEEVDLSIIHTGQHYDKNLNDVFFDQMEIPKVTHQLDTKGKNHNEQHAKLILQLSDALEEIRPDVCLFLGDANAVIGCIAPLKLGIPIAHIEAGMRSYNWDMPEERNRVIIDRVSDVLYTYQEDYRIQLVQEGIDPTKIVVTGNVIVDVLKEHIRKISWPKYPSGKSQLLQLINTDNVRCHVAKDNYCLMTLHRNEHMTNKALAKNIIQEVGRWSERRELPVVLIEMPRLRALAIDYPENFIVIEPQDFFSFVRLEKFAAIEFTDSGTNQEVASILDTPCVTTRTCTERPECWDCGKTVMADWSEIYEAAEYVMEAKRNEDFSLGDGNSSQRIVDDLIVRLKNNFYRSHSPCVDTFKRGHFKIFHKGSKNDVAYSK